MCAIAHSQKIGSRAKHISIFARAFFDVAAYGVAIVGIALPCSIVSVQSATAQTPTVSAQEQLVLETPTTAAAFRDDTKIISEKLGYKYTVASVPGVVGGTAIRSPSMAELMSGLQTMVAVSLVLSQDGKAINIRASVNSTTGSPDAKSIAGQFRDELAKVYGPNITTAANATTTLNSQPSSSGSAGAKPLTNADLVRMIKAGLGEDTIVLAIQSSQSEFDTSPDALIALKSEGATPKILHAIFNAKKKDEAVLNAQNTVQDRLAAANARARAAGYPIGASNAGKAQSMNSLGGIYLVDGDRRVQLQARGYQFVTRPGIFSQIMYHVIPNNRADAQTANSLPSFEFGLPSTVAASVKASDTVAMLKLDVGSDFRQFDVASIGTIGALYRRERRVPIVVEELKDPSAQSASGLQMVTYRIKPAAALEPGEYLLIMNGVTYYDFGIATAK